VTTVADTCIINPHSNFRAIWEIIGLVVITWDMCAIPFELAFLPGRSPLLTAMDWVTLFFWTGDMAQGFFLGFYEKGQFICSKPRIVRHYLATWFAVDVIVIGPDWLMVIAKSATLSGGNQVGGLGQIIKGIRAVRILRLMRLLKLQRIITSMHDMIEHEVGFIIFSLSELLVAVLLVNHVIACAWYFIGRLGMESHQRNWITTGDVDGESITYKYTTAMHWSLTQFTPASMDISARNLQERIFSIVILFFAMVVFSSIVASITSSTLSLRSMKTDEMKQFWLLRRYLRQRSVSKDLSERILKFLEHQYRRHAKLVQADSIKVLNKLSEELQSELMLQMYAFMLLSHPFFTECNHEMPVVMQRLCRLGITSQSYADDECVFNCGDRAMYMYFIKGGSYTYRARSKAVLTPELQPKEWVGEPVLWTVWRHQGTLSSKTASDLIRLDPKVFVDIFGGHPRPWFFAKQYARQFISFLNDWPEEMTDVLRDDYFYSKTVHECTCYDGDYAKLNAVTKDEVADAGDNPCMEASEDAVAADASDCAPPRQTIIPCEVQESETKRRVQPDRDRQAARSLRLAPLGLCFCSSGT